MGELKTFYQKFITVQTQFKTQIQMVRVDSGREYIAHTITNFFFS